MPIKFSAFNLLTSAGLVCNDLNGTVFVNMIAFGFYNVS